MNFTERYIKMCQEAKEIQESWKKQIGDYVAFPVGEDYALCIISDVDDRPPRKITVAHLGTLSGKPVLFSARPIGSAIWLPTIEQLIELYYGTANVRASEIATDLDCFVNPDWTFDLKETLLRMIMDLKYNKLWNNDKEEWIKVG